MKEWLEYGIDSALLEIQEALITFDTTGFLDCAATLDLLSDIACTIREIENIEEST